MKPLFIASILLLLFSCRQQKEKEDSLAGKWKPIGIKINGGMEWMPAINIDLTNEDSIRSAIIKNLQSSPYVGGDPSEVKRLADSTIQNMRNVFLQLKADSSFILLNNDIVIPTEPGWEFDEIVAGRWSKKDSLITLSCQHCDPGFSYTFRMVKYAKDTLVLQQSQTDPYNSLTLLRTTN